MVIRSSGSCRYESLETRSAVLDGLHRRRPSIPEASGHDESANGDAPRTRARRRSWTRPAAADEQGPKRLSDAIDAYLAAKRIRCSPRTIELEEERLSLVTKHFGDVPLSAITATAIAEFQRTRHEAGIANRTINMDVGVLSRVLKSCGRWRALADHVHNLPGAPASSRPRLDSRGAEAALRTPPRRTQNGSTCTAPPSSPPTRRCGRSRSSTFAGAMSISSSGSCTSGGARTRRATASSRSTHRPSKRRRGCSSARILLGHTEPEHYLWPACQWGRYDATKPMLKWDTAWRALRDEAGLPASGSTICGTRSITELAEMGVADHVLESISGHLSRRMLEHYSHIRIDAKRQALDALDAARRSTAHNGEEGHGERADRDPGGRGGQRRPHVTVTSQFAFAGLAAFR